MDLQAAREEKKLKLLKKTLGKLCSGPPVTKGGLQETWGGTVHRGV